MGQSGSRVFGNADYKLTYDDDNRIKNGPFYRPAHHPKIKQIKVLIDRGIIETVSILDSELTVGWLLSEVTRRYDEYYKDESNVKRLGLNPKKLIVGLKSVMFLPTLDYYLTELDNLLSPIKHKTTLTVHFAKLKAALGKDVSRRSISVDDFKLIKIIGKGSYSSVAIARKKDSGRLYAIKIMQKEKMFKHVDKYVFESESMISKKFKATPFVVDTHYAFQTTTEMFLVMELCTGGTLFDFLK